MKPSLPEGQTDEDVEHSEGYILADFLPFDFQ